MTSLPPIFDGKYQINPETGCWEWIKGKTAGYGIMFINGKRHPARRVAWIAVKGKFPPKMRICSKCRNKACINPSHLYLAESPHGENHAKAKLSEADVLEIRNSTLSLPELSEKFQVTVKTLCQIRNKTRWSHL